MLLSIGLLMLSLLEARQSLELGAAKGGRASRLKGAAQKQLRREQRRELHVKSRSRGHVMTIGLVLVHVLGVKRGNVGATRVAVSEARDVGGEGSMREASIAVGGLGGMAETRAIGTGWRSLASISIKLLHPEKVRGDERVPPSVTENSRFERFRRAWERHERVMLMEVRAAGCSREPNTRIADEDVTLLCRNKVKIAMRLLRGKSRGPPQIKPLYHRKIGVDERMEVICMQSDFCF